MATFLTPVCSNFFAAAFAEFWSMTSIPDKWVASVSLGVIKKSPSRKFSGNYLAGAGSRLTFLFES
ncbi:MAG: hypothetical protein VX469_02490, partial [Pseudomonadota bacterium]|nr:hypothetical protein [Pseudomonadota bacterium]